MASDDISRFFRVGKLAKEVRRVRSGVPDLVFGGIFGQADEEALDGYAINRARRLRYASASADLQEGDHVQIDGQTYLVMRHPERVNDGLESEARLSALTVEGGA